MGDNMEKWEKPKMVIMESEEPLGCMGAPCEEDSYESFAIL